MEKLKIVTLCRMTKVPESSHIEITEYISIKKHIFNCIKSLFNASQDINLPIKWYILVTECPMGKHRQYIWECIKRLIPDSDRLSLALLCSPDKLNYIESLNCLIGKIKSYSKLGFEDISGYYLRLDRDSIKIDGIRGIVTFMSNPTGDDIVKVGKHSYIENFESLSTKGLWI
jgi:hypothetical protein